jgi:hypothetical protein
LGLDPGPLNIQMIFQPFRLTSVIDIVNHSWGGLPCLEP